MISVGFAPNETVSDALVSLKVLFSPWTWHNTKTLLVLKNTLNKKFGFAPNDTFFYLTGRSALLNLFKSLEFDSNHCVAVQAFTCEAVVLPLLSLNIKPIYIDIERDSYSMDILDLKKKFNPNIKAIILQHTFAITPKYRTEIISFAREKRILVIEDLAHGFDISLTQDSSFRQSIKLLSFGRSKSFSSVFGGAIVASNQVLKEELLKNQRDLTHPNITFIIRLLLYKPFAVLVKSTYSIYLGKVLNKLLLGNVIPKEISSDEKNGLFDNKFNHLYPPALAVLLIHQLKMHEKLSKIRMENTKLYSKLFALQYKTALLRFPFVTKNKNKIISIAKKNNIFLGNWYEQAVAPNELMLSKVLYKKGSCKVAEETSEKILNLPTSVNQKQAEFISKLILNTI